MPEAVSDSRTKHPGRVAGGRKGALRRWGGQRIVRLDSLPPNVRWAVRTLIEADASAAQARAADLHTVPNEKAAVVSEMSTTAGGEGTHDADSAA